MPDPEPLSGATSGATRRSGEKIRDSLWDGIAIVAKYIPGGNLVIGGVLDYVVEDCHELLVRGLEEEVARSLAEGEEKLAEAEEEKKSLQLQSCGRKRRWWKRRERGTEGMGSSPPVLFLFWNFYGTQDMEGVGSGEKAEKGGERGDEGGEDEGGVREEERG